MYKLFIENFQSLESAVIELDGFITIQGPSNRGKSSVIRALGVLLYNEWDATYLRENTKECKISLEISEGEISKLEIIKPKNTYNVYFRDGKVKEYPKIDRDIPEDVRKEFGLNLVKTERGDKFNLNIQYQLDSMFLVSDREPVITSFLNKIFKIEQYEKALKAINADMAKLNKQSKKDQKELESKEIELKDLTSEHTNKEKQYGEIEKIYNEYIELKERIKYLEEGVGSFNAIEETKRSIEKLGSEYIWYEKLNTYLKDYLSNIAGINDITKLMALYYEGIEDINGLNKSHVESDKILERVTEYRNCVQKVGEFTFYINSLRIKEENNKKLSEECQIYNNIKISIEDYFNCTGELKSIREHINKLNKACNLLTLRNQELKEIERFEIHIQDILDSMETMLSVGDSIIELDKISNIKNELMSEFEGYKEMQTEIRGKENFIKIVVKQCPVCKKAL
jgi:DNA repair exonuclease SbcCD ATPase subunit